MTGFPTAAAVVFVLAAPFFVSAAAGETVVHKVADPIEADTWVAGQWNRAAGAPKMVRDVPAGLVGISLNSMMQEVSFSGKGFEFYRADPRDRLTIPGDLKRVTLWAKTDGKGYGWALKFQDGWGRGEPGGKKLEWPLKAETSWKKLTFEVPRDWIRPVTVAGLVTQNWSQRTKKATTRFWIDHIEVETDVSGVDPETGKLRGYRPNPNPNPKKGEFPEQPLTPLLSVIFSSPEEHNVFAGEKPVFIVGVRSWKPGTVEGKLRWKLLDHDDRAVNSGSRAVKVESTVSLSLPMDVARHGLYRLEASIAWSEGRRTTGRVPCAHIPRPHDLTDEEKDASPYGLNVHAGRKMMAATFRKAGIVWFRDYAFNFEWLVKAKGADRSYSGWPWYPKILKRYEEAGARVLACMVTAIRPPKDGTVAPDRAWTREAVDIVNAFPEITHWELDNEYDLKGEHRKAEEAVGWRNYRSYHRKFGEVCRILGGGEIVAVENGRAGVWPELLRACIDSGDFADIGVVNTHHYTGVDPPEANAINRNTGQAGAEQSMLYFDQLREVKRVALSDGRTRSHWHTEFGWDTLAGNVVTPLQQAAYLQRGYMLLMAAGVEKGFWFFDLDNNPPRQFFDGCGLVTHEQYPKLSFCACAALTHLLPKPEFVGTVNAGAGTWGYVFRNEGTLVAALWRIDGGEGPTVRFAHGKLYDFLANPIEGNRVALTQAPVYAVGIHETDRTYLQTAYMLGSPYLVMATAGDAVPPFVRVTGNRQTPVEGSVRLADLPEGWTDDAGSREFTADPGEVGTPPPLHFHISPDEKLGEKTVRIEITEAGATVKSIPLRVVVRLPLAMKVPALRGEPGEAELPVRVTNRSGKTLAGALKLRLPASWSTPAPEVRLEGLKPGETREVNCRVRWADGWREGESAYVEFTTDDGRSIRKPLTPDRISIHRAGKLVVNADLADWPASNRLPAWVVGSTAGEANADVYLAWSKKGLHIGLDVRDSEALTPDPRSFWLGDCLEVFLDTRDEKRARKYRRGDHQFWLVPQVEKGTVYLGRWKRHDEIPATLYDIKGIEGASRRTEGGYVLECLIPAWALDDWRPRAGTRIGLNLNLTVKGRQLDREAYWPAPKSEGVAARPELWGSTTLLE